MLPAGRCAPANRWRAFFFFSLAALAVNAAAPPGRAPELSQLGKPDAAEAARILGEFRQAGIPGQFFLELELRALLLRGEERVFQGRLWGGRNAQGAVTRIELTDAAGVSQRLLIQNGEGGAVWRFANGRVVALGVAELFAPLISGIEITAFDVQMPFLYWPDATLEKVTRSVLGRPAYAFLVRVPAAFAIEHGEITAARAYLDTQFNALIQTELIGRTNQVVKSFAFGVLKKVGDRYIPKQADYRNEVTRNKTRLQVTGAALNLSLPAGFFEPATLAEPGQVPAPAQIVRIDP
ncbi:MAG: hypothetical protein EXS37_12300 [Opitutus sp.]|nr:hypothetical protein [Opitutus sp.]